MLHIFSSQSPPQYQTDLAQAKIRKRGLKVKRLSKSHSEKIVIKFKNELFARLFY
jgi:hypothetical protein